MPPRPLLPDDDLYRRLEVPPDASFEAIEVAWRALLRRHHPDVAGTGDTEAAKAINVAHDWLSSPELRARYDRERGIRAGAGHESASRWRDRADRSAGATPARPRPILRRRPEDRRAAIARFLDRVSALTADELDRLDCAERTPVAFVATIERFLSDEQRAAVDAIEAAIEARLPKASWARAPVRDSVLGMGHELALGAFLDEHLDEPFRSRVRERLTRGWEAAVGQPRYGPNGRDVEALIRRVEALAPDEVRALAASSAAAALGPEPWPAGTTPEDDEALRVSSLVAGRDVAAVLPEGGLDRATRARARAVAARVAHLLVLRHAFSRSEWERLVAPWRSVLLGQPRRERPAVRRR